MPSPFPGMDPYLEAHWGDVHTSLVVYICDALQDQLPRELRARINERLVPAPMDDGLLSPRLVARFPVRPSAGLVEPLIVDAEPERLTERFIQIIDAGSGNRVVTLIEVLSPTNKLPGPDREQYLRKQREVRHSDTNLVEIDLVRLGRHTAAVPLQSLPPGRRTPYLVCVRRAVNRIKAEVYLIPLQQPLPAVKVPLRPTDADVRLDLQSLIEQAYQRGRYEGDLDYSKDPEPPLAGPDAAWADQLLREKGLRPDRPARRRKQSKRPRR